jgi:metallo-beta-lactamase class B
VAGNILVGNHAYPKIASDYRATFRTLETLKADIVLPCHPDIADVIEREALVAHFSAAFETELAAGR